MEDDIVISLHSYRVRAASRPTAPDPPSRPVAARIGVRATFFFDLGSPYTYLAAERADRGFALLDWQPVPSAASPEPFGDDAREQIAARADDLRLPLVWVPEQPLYVPRAMRVATLAAERGTAAEFVLAATRLTFAGSFDIEDPQILAVAGHAAGIATADVLEAAEETGRDAAMLRGADVLRVAGAPHLPAIRVGGRLFCGEERLPEAVDAARAAARAGSGPAPDELAVAAPDASSQRAS
jgi:2-hydroxychromene-2-carboxylate isomerase